MPRRSSRAVPASAPAPAPAPKRRASDGLSAKNTEAKRSKYNPTTAPSKPVKSTTKKSKYFGQGTSEQPESESKDESESEGFVSAQEDTTSPTPESKESNAASSDDEAQKKKRDKPQKQNNEHSEPEEDAVASLKGKELWREGVKTGLGPGKEVFIKKPKARDAGDVPYHDQTLHPNTMLFLQDLTQNNDRQWLKGNV